jgi:acetyl esterase/lipase
MLLAIGAVDVRAQASTNTGTAMARSIPWSVDSPVGALLDDPGARAVLAKHLPDVVGSAQISAARALPLRALKPYVPAMTDALLVALDKDLARVAAPAGVVPKSIPTRPVLDAFQLKTVPLWERGAPGALGERSQDKPALTMVTPIPEQATGAAVIVVPGGGYKALASNHEGRQVADWFAARGVTAFVLSYRLMPFGYRHPTQKQDAERAVRWVRAHAADYAIDPNRVGMIGFSAGGHITAMVGTQGAIHRT